MSKKITLPTGATVDLKDPKDLRVKDRKKIIKISDTQEGELSKAIALSEALVAVLVESWSFNLPIPSVDATSLDELEVVDYDALIEQTEDAQKILFPSFAETKEAVLDPKAITGNSKD